MTSLVFHVNAPLIELSHVPYVPEALIGLIRMLVSDGWILPSAVYVATPESVHITAQVAAELHVEGKPTEILPLNDDVDPKTRRYDT